MACLYTDHLLWILKGRVLLVIQGHASSDCFPLASFCGIFSSAELLKCQDFPETRLSSSSLPRRYVLSPENDIHLPWVPKGPQVYLCCTCCLEASSPFLLFGRLLLNLQEPDPRSSLQGSLPNSLPHPRTCTDAEDRTSALPDTVLTSSLKHVPHSFMTYLFKTQARSSSRSETLSQLSGFQNTGYDPLEGCEIISVVCNQQWFCFL